MTPGSTKGTADTVPIATETLTNTKESEQMLDHTTDKSTKAWDHVDPCTEVDWCAGHQVSDMEIGLDAHMSEPIDLHTVRFVRSDGRLVEIPLRVCKTQDRATGALTFDAALRLEDDMSVRALEGLGLQLADAGAALRRWAQEQIDSES